MLQREAMFYKSLPNDKVQCELCPHYCVLVDNESGKCRSRRNIDGVLYAINYGRTISLSVDPIEKKPLYHFLPGTSILSLGPNSCNFSCKFCQNYSISLYDAPTKIITADDLVSICKSQKINSVAFTYTEPFTWYEFIYDSAKILKDNDINIVMVTNGFINQKPLDLILPYIDALNIDLKSMSDDFYKDFCDGKLEPVLESIKKSSMSSHVEITNLLITGKNDSDENIQKIIDFMKDLNPEIPLHFSRYYPTYEMIEPPTPMSIMRNAYEDAKKELSHVYLGNILSEEETNTYCNNCGSLLIERSGYKTDVLALKNGRCTSCSEKIYGRW